ncbi:MAG: hypothetical protein FJW66_04825 [Actinobacteria bacterium]|nr:hypothetical protein [Actinomycetota bacterium]
MEENTQTSPLTLEELKNQIEDYRKSKSYNRQPIPKHLWQAAEYLARKHSIAIVSKELGLRYSSLKERIYGSLVSKNKIKEKSPSFVELKYNQPLMQEAITVDIENKKGARMRICLGSDTDIASLIKTFLSL